MPPLDPTSVAKWSPALWTSNVRMMLPSSDGAMGVLFAFAHSAATWSIPDADFVIKPSSASAASTMFAEEVLSKAAKATSMESVGVDPASPLGKAILATVDRFVDTYEREKMERLANAEGVLVGDGARGLRRAGNGNFLKRQMFKNKTALKTNAATTGDYPAAYGDRLKDLQRSCRNARTLLVQRMAQGMRGMDDEIRDTGLVEILHDQQLMKNLGRMFVADMVLGNGDRIDQSINMGNIARGADGSLFAIDSGTVLASFEDVLYDAQQGGGYAASAHQDDRGQLSPSGLAKGGFRGGQATPSKVQTDKIMAGTAVTDLGTAKLVNKEHVMLPPTAQLDLLFDPAKVWASFRTQMENKRLEVNAVRAAQGLPRFVPPTPPDWANAFQAFNAGVLSGLKRVDNLLSGFAWLRTKSKFKALTKAHGADANMDWTNFKMRRMVVHLARKGVPLDKAQEQAADYAERKLGHMVAF